jgi:glucans biosynthesis protein C
MQVKADRQYYIDWLRVGAMFLLVFYHSGRLFDKDLWHIKNAQLSTAIDAFNRTLDVWQMPLFFLAAGAAAWFSMGSRGTGTFAKERVLRLLIPFFFGILVIVPPQVYIERIFSGDFTGSFFPWYPHTFQGTYTMGDPSTGNLSWHHLWFLIYLFVFSMLLLPLFRYLRQEKNKGTIVGLASFLTRPGMVFLPAVPLIIINIFLRPIYGFGDHNLLNDWANFLFFMFVFFYGFILVSDGRITQAIKRQTFIALGGASVLLLFYWLNRSGTLNMPLALNDTIYAIDCWLWLLTFVGLAMRLLNFTNGLLRYANDAVLPFYILHQTMIVIIGYYVIRWNIPLAGKYFIVVAAVFASSLAIYEVVRRINVTRFLFGIKARKPALKKP